MGVYRTMRRCILISFINYFISVSYTYLSHFKNHFPFGFDKRFNSIYFFVVINPSAKRALSISAQLNFNLINNQERGTK